VWLERFGDGDTIYLAAFNGTTEPQSATVTNDPRAGMTAKSSLFEMVDGRKISRTGADSSGVTLAREDVRVFKVTR